MKQRPHKHRHSPKNTPQKKNKNLKIDLFGAHAVTEAWLNSKRHIHTLYLTENSMNDAEHFEQLARKAGLKRPSATIISKEELDRSLPKGTVHQNIALQCQNLEEVHVQDILANVAHKETAKIVLLDQVTDPHNIGAIIRSACAFGADGLIMQKKHTPALSGILAKTACGGLEHLPISLETNLNRTIELLQEHGFFVIGLDEHAEISLSESPAYSKTAIILGAEGSGLRRLVRENCDQLVKLPTIPPIASLNVSNAAAIALYDISTKESR